MDGGTIIFSIYLMPSLEKRKKKKEQWKSQANLNAEIFSFAQKRNTYRNILISQTLF